MDLPATRLNVQIPEFLLSDMWTLPEKFKNVSLCMSEANPLIAVSKLSKHFTWDLVLKEIPRNRLCKDL